jgi:hypothetical protein
MDPRDARADALKARLGRPPRWLASLPLASRLQRLSTTNDGKTVATDGEASIFQPRQRASLAVEKSPVTIGEVCFPLGGPRSFV